jgi:hypothetical protein
MNGDTMVLEKPDIILNKRDEAIMVHYMMLTRQITHLADCLFHIVRLETQPDGTHGSAKLNYRGYRAYSQSEISDAIVQMKKLCDILDLDFIDTYLMGMKRDDEKKKNYLETHPGDKWV